MLDVPVAFGRVLLRIRKERGLSQEALAGEAGLQRKYISLLEKAEYQPKITTIFRLAEALGCVPSDFIALVDAERHRRR
jgi:transcriptional regulator with XRE-family HTH domain